MINCPAKITCEQRDEILRSHEEYPGWSVYSSLTDPSGEYGEPRITTTWINDESQRLIEDVRRPDPDGGPDTHPCEHYDHGRLTGPEEIADH